MPYFRTMKLQFWALGKSHEPLFREAIETFSKRIENYYTVSWKIIPLPKDAGNLNENMLRRKEAILILEQLAKEDYLIALDERGRQLDSVGLSNFIMARTNESQKQIVFLIGGAFGLDEAILQRANFRWSLSQLTFPHQLVRLILAEQVYRACTIQRNERYHHS